MGHIQKIHIRNILEFQNDTVIVFQPEDSNGLSYLNTLVGNHSIDTRKVLECIEAINILRCSYRIERLDNQQISLKKITTSDDTQSSTEEINLESSANTKWLQLCIVKGPDPQLNFNKTDTDREGLFAVETLDDEGSPLYYGVYADAEEEDWAWHEETGHGGHRYSTAFVYCAASGRLFITSPNKSLQEKLIVEYPCKVNCENIIQSLVSCIKECLDEGKLCKDSFDTLPENLQRYLPSCIIFSQMKLQKVYSKTFSELLLKIINLNPCPTNCLLMDNPLDKVLGETKRCNYIRKFAQKCRLNGFQIIMTVFSNEVILNPKVDSVICLMMAGQNGIKVTRVPKEIIDTCFGNKRNLNLLDFLTYSLILLVEGPSDRNMINSVFSLWCEDDNKSDDAEEIEENHFKDLLEHTYIFSCEGKGSFHFNIDLFLKHPQLGFLPFIICDGDALFGGASKKPDDKHQERKKTKRKMKNEPNEIQGIVAKVAKMSCHETDCVVGVSTEANRSNAACSDVKEKKKVADRADEEKSHLATNLHMSQILGVNTSSVIYKCIYHLHQGRQAGRIYHKLNNAQCMKDTQVGCYLSSNELPSVNGKSRYHDLIDSILKRHCLKREQVWNFSEEYLYTFAWKNGDHPCDLEGMIKLTPCHRQFTKQLLSYDTSLVEEIAAGLLDHRNHEIERLWRFLRQHIFALHRMYTPPECLTGILP